MGEFSTLDGSHDVPSNQTGSVDGLGLTNPDSVLSGQNRGTQSIGGSPNLQSDATNQRLVVNDNTNNRVAFGRIGTGVNDWGMKVSKPGFSVDTATSDQLIFNSSQDIFKIVQTGTVSLTTTSGTGSAGLFTTYDDTVSVNHNLGFAPLVTATLFTTGGIYKHIPLTSMSVGTNSSIQSWTSWHVQTTSTNVTFDRYFTMYGALTVNSSTFTLKYYLLQESAS